MIKSAAPGVRKPTASAQGFTLIELLVTVAIISILASIALPAYSDFLTRSRFSEATATLAGKRSELELYYDNTNPHTYAGAPACAPDSKTSKFFVFDCAAVGATNYVLQATGTGAMSGFTFTIDQGNNKATTSAGSGWTANGTCWITSKSGAC